MTDEKLPPSKPEQQDETSQDVYYISETGSLWSPMIVLGQVRDFQGRITRYMLGDPKDPTKTLEVPVDWFEQHKDELRIPEDGEWSVAGKPTLETPVSRDSKRAEHSKSQDEQKKLATVAIGSVEAPQDDARAEIVRLESELSYIYQSLSESDKRAVWLYASAVNDQERARKVTEISDDIRQSGLHLKYLGAFEQLREARKRAGIL